jgi:phosphoglycerate dehydrogenase-like enzyme
MRNENRPARSRCGNKEHGTTNMEHGTRNNEHGTWNNKHKTMNKIKFAVVGCGHIGKRHAEMI